MYVRLRSGKGEPEPSGEANEAEMRAGEERQMQQTIDTFNEMENLDNTVLSCRDEPSGGQRRVLDRIHRNILQMGPPPEGLNGARELCESSG